MRWGKTSVTMTMAALLGCSAPVGGPTSNELTGGAEPSVPAATSVRVQGLVTDLAGQPVVGAEVARLALDPYLEGVLTTHTDAAGSFVLDGAAPDTREWLAFSGTGYFGLYRAVDTTAAPLQTLPSARLLTMGEVGTLAESFGASLDTGKGILCVPLSTVVAGKAQPAAAGEVQVTFTPSLGAPVFYSAGEAVALNVAGGSYYSVTATRAGRACLPSGHPELVQPDGSVRIATPSGYLTEAPAMTCP